MWLFNCTRDGQKLQGGGVEFFPSVLDTLQITVNTFVVDFEVFLNPPEEVDAILVCFKFRMFAYMDPQSSKLLFFLRGPVGHLFLLSFVSLGWHARWEAGGVPIG